MKRKFNWALAGGRWIAGALAGASATAGQLALAGQPFDPKVVTAGAVSGAMAAAVVDINAWLRSNDPQAR